MLAAYLDQQNDQRPITAGRGAWNGFLAGVIGAFVWLLVSIALDVVLAPIRERLASELIRVARDMPPDARAALESIGSLLTGWVTPSTSSSCCAQAESSRRSADARRGVLPQ